MPARAWERCCGCRPRSGPASPDGLAQLPEMTRGALDELGVGSGGGAVSSTSQTSSAPASPSWNSAVHRTGSRGASSRSDGALGMARSRSRAPQYLTNAMFEGASTLAFTLTLAPRAHPHRPVAPEAATSLRSIQSRVERRGMWMIDHQAAGPRPLSAPGPRDLGGADSLPRWRAHQARAPPGGTTRRARAAVRVCGWRRRAPASPRLSASRNRRPRGLEPVEQTRRTPAGPGLDAAAPR
jgi:hypothetical protein